MSDNYIILIPTDPSYVPPKSAQNPALRAFASFVSPQAEVEAVVSDEIEFVHPGENLEKISCPVCAAILDDDWWSQAMDVSSSSEPAFSNLLVQVPCCGATLSLNDLVYDWPAGFASFNLEALYPDVLAINDAQITQLETMLGCKLRQIWAHY